MADKANCYTCVHRGTLSGNAHSFCGHPATGMKDKDEFDQTLAMLIGGTSNAAITLGICAKEHGVRSGWFMWPANFDPVWLVSCMGYEKKSKAVEANP